jgi:uncharacterized pyridoxal phosphate-containing UPF0001 family protein
LRTSPGITGVFIDHCSDIEVQLLDHLEIFGLMEVCPGTEEISPEAKKFRSMSETAGKKRTIKVLSIFMKHHSSI